MPPWLPANWFSEIVELLTGFAWPITIFVGLLIFRKALSELIRRPFRIGREGVEFGPATQSASADVAQEARDKFAKLPEHPDPLVRPYIDQLDRWVREKLDEAAQLLRPDRETILVRGVVDYLGALHLERAYRDIFWSQIQALMHLQQAGGSDKRASLVRFYSEGAAKYPDFYRRYSFEQWLSYLTAWQLIEVSGDDVVITPAGKALVPHVLSQGLSLLKPG